MDHQIFEKMNNSIIIKFFLGLFIIAQLLVALLISRIPSEPLFLPADRVQDGDIYLQPITIQVIDPYIMQRDNNRISRIEVVSPGDYSYQLTSPDGEQQTIEFSIFIYDSNSSLIMALGALAPFLLLIYTFRREAYGTHH